LEEKDEIFVLSKTDFFDKKQTIAVLGVVRNPGDDFGFAQNMTLRDALIRANGFNTGADISRIELERFETVAGVSAKSIVKEIKLRDTVLFRNYDPQLDMKLQNSDRIIVRTIPNFKGYRFVSIKGEVKYPGEYLLLKDDEKLLDLIERAGGLTAIAAPRDAVLTRSDTEENLGFILMDLEKAQATPNSTYNYKLKQGDLITVPATKEFVTIQGAVESEEVEAYKRVSIAYQEGKDIPYYIDEYVGGIDREKRGRYYLTSVRYPNGVTKKTKSYFFHLIKKYPPIRAGAIITVKAVPEKAKKADGSNNGETKKVDWESVMQKTTAAITTILLITTLGTQLSASIGGR
jgi:protein involved in polysaccharide export with SLBB domain